MPAGELPDTLPQRTGSPAEAIEDRDLLWTALGRLGARERAAVVLRYFADLDNVRIAEILECSPGTVRSQISRALGKLRVDSAVQIFGTGS